MNQDNQEKNSIPCKICGNPKAEKRYNSYACNSCRLFFYRHYDSSFTFHCDTNERCEISYLKSRINCTFCRLMKCYDSNMTINDGRRVVGRLHIANSSYQPMKKFTEIYGKLMNNGFKFIGNLKNCQSSKEWIDRLAQLESHLLSLDGASASSVTANTNMSLYDFVMFPGFCINRCTRAIDLLSDSSMPSTNVDPMISYKLRETLLRLHVAAIETLSLIDEFHLLPDVDKIKLVQQNALMMPCCYILYNNYRQGWDAQTCAKYLERYRMDDGPAAPWKNIVDTWKSGGLVRMDAMQEVRPTEKEMMLMRIRSYFRPGVEHTEEGYHIIIRIRLKLALVLGEHIRETNPSFDCGEVQKRLRQILELEELIRACANGFNQAYVMLTLVGAFGFDTPLTRDIFIRNF